MQRVSRPTGRILRYLGRTQPRLANWLALPPGRALRQYHRWRPDRHKKVVVSDQQRFAFFQIAKVANNSFAAAFTDPAVFPGAGSEKGTYSQLLRRHPGLPDYFKLAFVRNPYHRVVSAYVDKVQNMRPHLRPIMTARYKGLSPKMTFGEFAEWLCTEDGQDSITDRHWMSQYLAISNDDGEPVCDFIGRLENLSGDLREATERMGLGGVELKMPHFNSAAQLHGTATDDFRAYYDDRSRELITQRYARDLELFGYTFEP